MSDHYNGPIWKYTPPEHNYTNPPWVTATTLGNTIVNPPWVTTTTLGKTKQEMTPMALLEAIVQDIVELERILGVNDKDQDKIKYLNKLMGLVQEHELNLVTKRLKALNI